MEYSLLLIVFIITVALVFDFTNGVHDAANSVATIVSTRVLTPRQAVAWAAFFNFIAFFIFGTAVAKTVGKGLIDIDIVTPYVILGGLLGAIAWNLITWYWGLPTSSSHALIGGYAGAAITAAGTFNIIIFSGWIKTIIFIILAPLIGIILGFVFISITTAIVQKHAPTTIDKWARRFQFISAALYSLGHGGNDAQKTAGIITSLLFSAGVIKSFDVPFWVMILAYTAIGFGTYFGGWRIVKTMGQKITKLKSIDGFCAEAASASTLFFATYFGIPVSTTHVITSAISGVGAAKRFSAVRWGITLRIVWAWIFTIPCSAILAACFFIAIRLFL